jgi:hypothetical protein
LRSHENYSPQTFSIEHIIPIVLGGSDDFENLAYSCQGCNSFKSSKISALDVLSGKEAALFNPRMDDWFQHFAWDESYKYIIGITPVGRATVSALKLNRFGVVNLREVLIQAKVHPPEHFRKNDI